MNLTRILGCVGAVTLCVVACNDKDVVLIHADAGVGGSNQGNAGSGGSGGNGGSAGTSAGSGGNGGSAGTSAGSGGVSGSAGMSSIDPDGGTDSGTPAGPYAEICESYCAVRTAWATATGDAGVNCPGWDSAGCQAGCEAEFVTFVETVGCTAYTAAVECHISANVWFCDDDPSNPGSQIVYANNCESTVCQRGGCDNTCNVQVGAMTTSCFGGTTCSSN